MIHTPEMIEILGAQAAVPVGNSVTAFNEEVLKEARFWERVVKETGIEPE